MGAHYKAERCCRGGSAIFQRSAERDSPWPGLAIVLVLAVAARVYLIATTVVVARDGVTFIQYAKGLAADPIAEIRAQDQHPGYPAILLATHRLIGQWLGADPVDQWPLAGQIAAAVFSLGAVLAAYAIGAWVWSVRVGLITALFMGMLPRLCQVSSDALSDAPHLTFYLWGLAFLIRALKTEWFGWLLAASACSACAFLIRPEGGSVLVVGVAVVLVQRRATAWSWRGRVMAVVAMGVVFFAVAGPYMAASGRVVKKKNVFELFGLDEAVEAAVPHRAITADPQVRPLHRADTPLPLPVFLLYHWIRACRVVYFVLAIPALFIGSRARPREALPIAFAGGLHLILLTALQTSFGYLSLRHMMVLAALTLPFSAVTFVWLVELAVARFASEARQDRLRVRVLATVLGAACAIGPTVPYILRTIGGDSGHLVAAGRWLRAHSEPGQLVMTTRTRLAYYADRPRLYMPDTAELGDLAQAVAGNRPDYVALDASRVTAPHRNPAFFEQLGESALGGSLQKIYESPGLGRDVVIYRVRGTKTSCPGQ